MRFLIILFLLTTNSFSIVEKENGLNKASKSDSILHVIKSQLEYSVELKTDNPDSAKLLVEQLINMAKEHQLEEFKGLCYYRYAEILYSEGNQLGIEYLDSAEYHLADSKDFGLMSDIKKLKGNFYFYSKQNEERLKYYLEALAIAEKHELFDKLPAIKNNIGLVYEELGNYDKAMEHLRNSYEISVTAKDSSLATMNIGYVHMRNNLYDSASIYYNLSLRYCDDNDETCKLRALGYLNVLYMKTEQYEKSISISLELEKKRKATNSFDELLKIQNQLGLIYSKTGRFQEANTYFEKAYAVAKSIDSRHVPYIGANIAENQAAAGNYQAAFDRMQVFVSEKDSMFQVEREALTEDLLAKYESDTKQKEIERLEHEASLNAIIHSQNKLVRNILIVGIIIVSLISFFLIRFYRKQIQTSLQLANMTRELSEQKEIEHERELEIERMIAEIDGKEKERERIAQDLHDGVEGSLAGMKMKIESLSLPNKFIEDKNELISALEETYWDVRNISHNLTLKRLLNTPFSKLIKEYMLGISKMTGIEVSVTIVPENQINELASSYRTEIYRIIQELVSNTIKHARAITLDVQLTKVENDLVLLIEDDGTGYDVQNSSKGIGLANLEGRASLLGGKVFIDSVIGRGTITKIDVPAWNKNQAELNENTRS